MKGQFHAVVNVQDKSVDALFFVCDGDNVISNLMSAKTARDLSLLHVQAAVSEQNLDMARNFGYLSPRIKQRATQPIYANEATCRFQENPLRLIINNYIRSPLSFYMT